MFAFRPHLQQSAESRNCRDENGSFKNRAPDFEVLTRQQHADRSMVATCCCTCRDYRNIREKKGTFNRAAVVTWCRSQHAAQPTVAVGRHAFGALCFEVLQTQIQKIEEARDKIVFEEHDPAVSRDNGNYAHARTGPQVDAAVSIISLSHSSRSPPA